MAQWRGAAEALAAVHRRELKALTPEQALRASEALLDLTRTLPVPEARWRTSGMVEQQRWFHRGRR